MQATPAQLIAATERLLPALVRERPGTCALGPSIDGEVLPEDPIEAMAAGRAHPVPLVIGSNADEATLVTRVVRYVPGLPGYIMPVSEPQMRHMLDQTDAASRARLFAAYPGYPRSATRTRLAQDGVFGRAVWTTAEAHGLHQPTYVYRYDYAPRTLRWLGLGASHATELLAVFGTYGRPLGRVLSLAGDRASARRVSDDMTDRWIAFADSAAPGAGWPVYREDERAVLVFDSTSRVELDPDAERRLAWRDYEAGCGRR
jgi:para-nitrobenzyl esterase